MILWNQYHHHVLRTPLLQTLFCSLSTLVSNNNKASIPINFVEGTIKKEVLAKEGENILDICKRNNIQIIGACEGNCACSTCHVILEAKLYNKLQRPTESEEDMLDLAYGVTPTSRLACQIKASKDFIGTNIIVLEKQRNVTQEAPKDKTSKH